MIISRTPYRISFVGGGTDLRSFYSREEGQVLSTTIDKFVYVAVRRQIGIVQHKFRINWESVEQKDRVDEIEHPIVRVALQLLEIDVPLEISVFWDVPPGTGLGSSSSFAVGLLHALFALKGQHVTKSRLATMAAGIEIDQLGRTMGAQDHYAAAYGNYNVLTFHKEGTVSVEPVFYRPETKRTLEQNLLLFYTAIQRNAADVLRVQADATDNRFEALRQMKQLVDPVRDILSSGKDLNLIGRILHQGWELKRSLTALTSTPEIDGYYERALGAGAIGGKLLGAGGGGFLLLYVEPQNQAPVRQALNGLYELQFMMDSAGSRITYYDQSLL